MAESLSPRDHGRDYVSRSALSSDGDSNDASYSCDLLHWVSKEATWWWTSGTCKTDNDENNKDYHNGPTSRKQRYGNRLNEDYGLSCIEKSLSYSNRR